MRWRFTLIRETTSINSIPSWEDLGGSHPWVGGFLDQSVTLGASAVSNILADNIINPYLGTYNFLITASGTINGGSGKTAQITFQFLDADENIIDSSDAVDIPNDGLTDYAFTAESLSVTPFYIGIQVNNLTSSSNTITVALTYVAPDSSLEISEPGGWKDHKIKWERHPDFFSIVESLQAELTFYGVNTNNGINGGIDFINTVAQHFGFNAHVRLFIEAADDDVNFVDYWDGYLPLDQLERFPDNTATCPIIKNNLWAKLLNAWEIPVDVSSTATLGGNACEPAKPINLHLTSQVIRKNYQAHIDGLGESYAQFTNNSYYWIDFNDVIAIDEISDRKSVPRVIDTILPSPNFIVEEGGSYHFDIRIIASHTDPGDLFDYSVKTPDDYIDYYIQFGNQTPIAFDWADEGTGAGSHTLFTFSGTYELNANTSIRIYGRANLDSANDLIISGGDSSGFPGSSEFASYCNIIGDTTFPDTEAQGYLIHDLFSAVLERILQ